MEIALIWFISMVALGEQDKATNARIDQVEMEILNLEKQDLKQAAAIASQRALQQVNHSNQQNSIVSNEQRIESVVNRVDFLDNKMIELHN